MQCKKIYIDCYVSSGELEFFAETKIAVSTIMFLSFDNKFDG